jgi:hypothetical protein
MKLIVKNWIVRAELSDGKTVNLDVDNETANAVDSFITSLEEDDDLEDWIADCL